MSAAPSLYAAIAAAVLAYTAAVWSVAWWWSARRTRRRIEGDSHDESDMGDRSGEFTFTLDLAALDRLSAELAAGERKP